MPRRVSKRLTARQQQVLDFIKRRIRERGYPPSVREIGAAIGLSSSSTVHGHLNRLEEKGFIKRDPTKPRAIEVLDADRAVQRTRFVAVPLVGRVTAGEPILAVENVEDIFPLPYDLVGHEEVFMLRVRGDSMVNVGIYDGDWVLVRRQETADDGDVVVALLDDEATVKRLYRQNGRIRLQPENDAMAPIVTDRAEVLGKVIGLFRRL